MKGCRISEFGGHLFAAFHLVLGISIFITIIVKLTNLNCNPANRGVTFASGILSPVNQCRQRMYKLNDLLRLIFPSIQMTTKNAGVRLANAISHALKIPTKNVTVFRSF